MDTQSPSATDRLPVFLSVAMVCHRYGFSPSTLRRAVKRKDFPPPRRLSVRRVGWLRADLDAHDVALEVRQ
jgi:predicted DNA-binding transcriptional regulator AlpA